MATRSVTARLDEGLVDRLDAEAERLGVKRTAVIEGALEAALAETAGSSRRAPAEVLDIPGVVRAKQVRTREEPLKPMSPDGLREWKRAQTGRGHRGVA